MATATNATANDLMRVLETLDGLSKQAKELRAQKKELEGELMDAMERDGLEEIELSNGVRMSITSALHMEKPSGRRKRATKGS